MKKEISRLTTLKKSYLIGLGSVTILTVLILRSLLPVNNPQRTLSGRVRTADGQAIPEARVYFTSGPVALPDIASLTDVQGNFSLSVPAAGVYQIGCTADGFRPARISVNVNPDQDTNVELTLKK